MSFDPAAFRVRPAILDDAPALAQVFRETWRASYREVLPPEAFVELPDECFAAYWRQTLAGAGSNIAVLSAVDEDDDAVGLALAGPDRFDDGSRAEIYSLYVMPGYQGLGLGRRLLRASFGVMQAAGFRSGVVWTLAAHESRGFYERLGGCIEEERASVEWGYEVPQVSYVWPDLAALTRGEDARAGAGDAEKRA